VNDDMKYVDEETQFVVIEELVAQVHDDGLLPVSDDLNDTAPTGVPSLRAQTVADWPPEPPLPADVDLAQGTETHAAPVRNAQFYAAVRRPTTSSEDT
jgi:hypothetical protein